jgi:hypothetical protein
MVAIFFKYKTKSAEYIVAVPTTNSKGKADAEQFVPPNLLLCLELIEELMCTKNWKKRITDNERLFKAVDKMSKDEVIIV